MYEQADKTNKKNINTPSSNPFTFQGLIRQNHTAMPMTGRKQNPLQGCSQPIQRTLMIDDKEQTEVPLEKMPRHYNQRGLDVWDYDRMPYAPVDRVPQELRKMIESDRLHAFNSWDSAIKNINTGPDITDRESASSSDTEQDWEPLLKTVNTKLLIAIEALAVLDPGNESYHKKVVGYNLGGVALSATGLGVGVGIGGIAGITLAILGMFASIVGSLMDPQRTENRQKNTLTGEKERCSALSCVNTHKDTGVAAADVAAAVTSVVGEETQASTIGGHAGAATGIIGTLLAIRGSVLSIRGLLKHQNRKSSYLQEDNPQTIIHAVWKSVKSTLENMVGNAPDSEKEACDTILEQGGKLLAMLQDLQRSLE